MKADNCLILHQQGWKRWRGLVIYLDRAT